MLGTRSPLPSFRVCVICLALVGAGCSKPGTPAGTTTTMPSSEESPTRSSRPTRGEISCHLHSCAPPKYCNRDKGVCELLPCTDSRDCPYGYKCDYAKGGCQ